MGTSVSQTTGIMVTKILAILGLMLIGNCYAQWDTLSGYGGHSNPTWDYKPNFKPSSISEIFGGNSMRSVMRQIAKRSAADANPDFDHFSATRGKRSEDPDFDHFSATRGKRSATIFQLPEVNAQKIRILTIFQLPEVNFQMQIRILTIFRPPEVNVQEE